MFITIYPPGSGVYVLPGENEYPSGANIRPYTVSTPTPQDLPQIAETHLKTPRFHTGAADNDGHFTLDLPPMKIRGGAIIKMTQSNRLR